MKNLGKLATLGAVLVASTSFAFGATIQLASYGQAGLGGYDPVISNTNPNVLANGAMTFVGSVTNPTFASLPAQSTIVAAGASLSSVAGYVAAGTTAFELNPSGVWTAAPAPPTSAYVGSTNTSGPSGTVNPAYGYYEYTTTISGLGATYTGTLSVLADDTTEVLLTSSGGTTPLIGFGGVGGDMYCADNVPDCVTVDTIGLTLPAGTDTLTFIVYQDGNSPTGGAGGVGNPSGVAFDATLNVIPEPSSLMLLGSGLIGAAGMFFRRRATV